MMKNNTKNAGWGTACIVIFVIILGALAWWIWDSNKKDPIVGAWFVKAADAPFAYHMFTFHDDGTMGQANPDGGNPNTSDSDGAGVWERNGDKIKGKFTEVTADRGTHMFASKGEIRFEFRVDGDRIVDGTASANFYDESGKLIRGPLPTPLEGQRVTLP